jgi:hypothetical protein
MLVVFTAQVVCRWLRQLVVAVLADPGFYILRDVASAYRVESVAA